LTLENTSLHLLRDVLVKRSRNLGARSMKAEPGSAGKREGQGSESGEDIKIDKEFAALIPPLSKDELAHLEQSLLEQGCRDPLVIWAEKNILLDGHNRLPICRKHNIPFEVKPLPFPNREAAEAFIVKNQLGRRNLSQEAASYLRGKRYLAEKQTHGGERTKGSSGQNDQLMTSQRLAEEYKVGEKTIRRDGEFAEAVDGIAENCGEKAKQAILARDAGLTRGGVLRLSKMKVKDQQKAIQELLEKGKLPRKPRSKKRTTITLPTEPKSLAQKLFDSLGAKSSSEVMTVLAELLKEQKSKD
jgi:hypothetical protein